MVKREEKVGTCPYISHLIKFDSTKKSTKGLSE